jgi:hypothetical protein
VSAAEYLFGPEPLCCGGGSHDGHAAWCAWSRISAPAPVLDEAVCPDVHEGRYSTARACSRCRVPKGEPGLASALAGPVVELDAAHPLTDAGERAGWGA